MVEVINVEGADPEWVASSLSHIARHLRDQERAEIEAMHPGEEPAAILVESVLLSTHAWIILLRGEPVAIVGAAPSPLPSIGIVWMLSTDRIVRCGRTVARQTVQYLDLMHAAYPLLWNYIDSRNSVSLKWLEWCGFELVGDHATPAGVQFHIFARSAAKCATP